METTLKTSRPRTPAKQPNQSRPISKKSENLNPNESNSPISKSASKSRKSASNNPNHVSNSPSHKNRIQERKFFVSKSNISKDLTKSRLNCECKKGSGKQAKCLCLAQQEFLKNGSVISDEIDVGLSNKGGLLKECGEKVEKDGSFIDENINGDEGRENLVEEGKGNVISDEIYVGLANKGDLLKGCGNKVSVIEKDGSFIDENIKRDKGRENLVEEGKRGGFKVGSSKVMHLVKAFENILSLPKSNGNEKEKEEKDREDKGTKSVFPKVPEMEVSVSTSESLGLESHVSASLDGGNKENGGESSGAFGKGQWKRRQMVKTTAYVPFKLMTEERGKCKVENFRKKLQHMMEEEEKLRIPLAQSLPGTTDEPECLMKPPIKDITTPIDLVLHSDIRAEERADFDHQIAEKMSFVEQYKREKERQQKLAEEEEIRRLRKELVPKAQPMPYFDRPFFPKKVRQAPHNGANVPMRSQKSIQSCSDENEGE